MKENIIRIEIDNKNVLRVYPQTKKYTYIYRSAMNVRWNDQENYLYIDFNSESRNFAKEYELILSAVKDEYNDMLLINKFTTFINIDKSVLKM